MSGPEDTWRDGSAAPPTTPTASSADTHPFTAPEHSRYAHRAVLGWGGMGEVRASRDQRLRRDVAYKTVRLGTGTHQAARLAQEAWITARLDHPNIVPVHDCGRTTDGRLFFTMRLIRGRTLAAALADCLTPAERLTLLRPLLSVCEAVAYAHSLGVVHRDLKPANIMVGSFGETQVVDWGLASEVGTAHDPAVPEGHRDETDGAFIGTPAYASPEQALGTPAAPTHDVWSLGVVLHEVLTGRPAFTGTSGPEVLEAVRRSGPLHPMHVDGTVPPELDAIVQRATAPALAERYPNASALARDLAAWLDGRRVAAHQYTATELLQRYVRRWRAPLAVASVALVVLAVGGVVSLQRTTAERDRALEAERAAERITARTLASRAQLALLGGDPQTAEQDALAALELDEVPLARGVLAHSLYGSRLTPIPGGSLSLDCEEVLVPGRHLGVLCLNQTSTAWFDLTQQQQLWQVEEFAEMQVAHHGNVLWHTPGGTRQIALPSGAPVFREQHPLTVTDGFQINRVGDVVVDGQPRRLPQRPHEGHALALSPDGTVLALQAPDSVLRITREQTLVTALPGTPSALAYNEDGDLFLTTWGGLLLRLRGEDLQVFEPDMGPLVALAVAGDRAVVASEAGRAALFDLSTGSRVATLPMGRATALAFDGETLHLVGPTGSRAYRVPEKPDPARLQTGSREGVIALGVSPDQSSLVALGYDVRRFERATGIAQVLSEREAFPYKDLAWTATGDFFTISSAGGTRRWTMAGPTDEVHDTSGRRLVALQDGRLLASAYVPHLLLLPSGERIAVQAPLADLEASGEVVYGLDGASRILRLMPEPVLLFDAPDDARALIPTPTGQLWLARAETLELRDPDGTVRASVEVDCSTSELTLSADARWLAQGCSDGGVRLWDTRSREVVLQGQLHQRNVPALVFTDDDQTLITGSWDSSILMWDLTVLEAPLTALRASVEAVWGAEDRPGG